MARADHSQLEVVSALCESELCSVPQVKYAGGSANFCACQMSVSPGNDSALGRNCSLSYKIEHGRGYDVVMTMVNSMRSV